VATPVNDQRGHGRCSEDDADQIGEHGLRLPTDQCSHAWLPPVQPDSAAAGSPEAATRNPGFLGAAGADAVGGRGTAQFRARTRSVRRDAADEQRGAEWDEGKRELEDRGAQ
jgi:hypothetical protein